MKRPISVVMVGEVDHGKSSVLGQLLAATEVVPQARIEQIQSICKTRGKDFEYAFVLDAFKEEQKQGVMIDVSHIHLRSKARSYHFIDSAGHREFLKNMVSGARAAQAAVILIDAKEGIKEQSKRHCMILKLLGVEHSVVVINKIDLCSFSEERFEELKRSHELHMEELGLKAQAYIPVSAKLGLNLSTQGCVEMPWYRGPALLDALDRLDLEKKSRGSGFVLRFKTSISLMTVASLLGESSPAICGPAMK